MHPLLARLLPLMPSLMRRKSTWAGAVLLLAVGYLVTGSAAGSLDWLWKEPRDLLVDRVEESRDSQREAAEQFRDALDEFKSVVNLPGSELEQQYNRLNASFNRSKASAADVSRRVSRVVDASNRLLDEWREELDDYNDAGLRRLAEQQFDETREQATRLIESMRQIERRMEPVLASFQDQVLYLKHNLNLSAIAALEGEAIVIESNVDSLIADMNRSIAEADAFIDLMLERG